MGGGGGTSSNPEPYAPGEPAFSVPQLEMGLVHRSRRPPEGVPVHCPPPPPSLSPPPGSSWSSPGPLWGVATEGARDARARYSPRGSPTRTRASPSVSLNLDLEKVSAEMSLTSRPHKRLRPSCGLLPGAPSTTRAVSHLRTTAAPRVPAALPIVPFKYLSPLGA